MYSAALTTAFDARLLVYASAQNLAVDWGDRKDYRPAREKWLRPRLNEGKTEPGPSNAGPLRGTFRGLYSVECFAPIADVNTAVAALADAVAAHFFPGAEPRYLDNDASLTIHLGVPSVMRQPADDDFNRAVTHVPYLVYAIA